LIYIYPSIIAGATTDPNIESSKGKKVRVDTKIQDAAVNKAAEERMISKTRRRRLKN
jgi:hypothetical protein